ncbi:MAG: FkbM family methyltransferase [Candidatus Rokuibacteriota bacterium]
MAAPLVSIVTPALNQGRFIRATIESVLAQDYPHVEYLVIDGGSTDATASIVDEYRGRLTWISEPDRGQAHAINKGFRMARGEVVAWLNSDDLLLPRAVSAAVEALEADRELALVYGDAYVIDEDGFMRGSIRTGEPDPWQLANVADYIVQPAAFFRPWALQQVGYLDESLHWCLDWDVFIRLSRRWPTRRIAEHLAVGRVYDAAKTQSGGFRRFREMRALMRRYADRRFPPVFFLYACDAASTSIDIRVRRVLGRLGLDGELLGAAIDAAVFGAIRHRVLTPGVYEDRWVGGRADVVLRGQGDVLEVTGFVPPVFGRRRPQRLELHLDGRRLGAFEVPPGDFALTLPIGDGGERLSLRAARLFSGARQRTNDDPRRLAFRLHGARRRPASDVEIWHASGRYADGWVAPVLRLRLRRRGHALRLRGSVPRLDRETARQRLEIRCNGRVSARHELDPGDFDLTVPVPEGEPLLDLELRAERHFVFDERPSSRRPLGFRLNEVAWAGGARGSAVLGEPTPPRAVPFEGMARQATPAGSWAKRWPRLRPARPLRRAALLEKLGRRANPAGLRALRWVLLHPVRTLHPNVLELRRRRQARRRRVSTFWGSPMTVYPPEAVSNAILRWGFHEPDLSALLILGLGPGKTFFDVGAHFGYFSLLADHVMEGAGQVHAFEPTPSSFAVLAENIAGRESVRATAAAVWKDGFGAEIQDYGVALSAYNSLRGARIPGLVDEWRRPAVTEVRTVALDDYCRSTGARPDLVKVDAEGAEMEILQGMSSLVLPELRPIVTLEVGDLGVAGVAPSRALVETMLSHGYAAWEPHRGDLLPHEPIEHYPSGNLVFTPGS